jgi:hypothetical protein
MNAQDTIAVISTGFMNTVNDALPGQPVSSGTGQAHYGGQVGKILAFNHTNVAWSGTQLYGGKYQYVKLYLSSSAAAAAGQVASWYDLDDYVVTADALTGTSLVAGIFLNAITKGNYGWIQISGLATVKFRAAITKATPAIGDLVLVQAGAYVGDVLADVTNLTSVEQRSTLGVTVAGPTNGGSSLVALWLQYENV